jgi:dGTPase
MFERVYLAPAARAEHAKIHGVIATLFDHHVERAAELPGAGDPAQRVTDWIAGMTDRFCLRAFTALTVPLGHAA